MSRGQSVTANLTGTATPTSGQQRGHNVDATLTVTATAHDAAKLAAVGIASLDCQATPLAEFSAVNGMFADLAITVALAARAQMGPVPPDRTTPVTAEERLALIALAQRLETVAAELRLSTPAAESLTTAVAADSRELHVYADSS